MGRGIQSPCHRVLPVMTEDLKWNAVFTHMPDNQTISFEVESRDTGRQAPIPSGFSAKVFQRRKGLSSNLPGIARPAG